MKIEFPLWVVLDPEQSDTLAGIRRKTHDYADLEGFMFASPTVGVAHQERNPAIYTTEAEAAADAQARLDARDGKEPDNRGPWISLAALRDGAIFETKDGVRAVKSEYCYDNYGACECTLLTSGRRAHFAQGDYADARARAQAHNATLVREITL